MQTKNSTNINFKSDIHFVNRKQFNSICSEASSPQSNITRQYIPNKKEDSYILNCQFADTYQVRTCTAGCVTNSKSKVSPLCFHLYDSKETLDYEIPKIAKYINGDSLILVGAKEHPKKFPYATKVMDKLIKIAETKNIPVSYFKGLDIYCEVDFCYDALKDKAYICVNRIFPPGSKCIVNKDTLKDIFSQIKISAKDKIHFGL